MSKRTYNKIQHLLRIIQEKLATGMTQEEVAKELGLTGKKAIKNLLKRERKKELAGIPQVRGRKPARTLQEYKAIPHNIICGALWKFHAINAL